MESAKTIKRKQILLLVGGVGGFVAALILGMWIADPNRGKPTALEIQGEKAKEIVKDYRITSQSVVSPEENWIALSEKEMSNIKTENKELIKKVEELNSKMIFIEQMKNKKEEGKGDSFKLLDPLPSSESKSKIPSIPLMKGLKDDMAQTVANSRIGSSSNEGSKVEKTTSGIEVVDLSDDLAKGEKDIKKKKNNISHFIPSGSFAKVVLISGIDAPTGGMAQKNPMPVLMKILDNGQLPNYFKSKIKDCHATGAASGDISSERACIRLEKLSCVLNEGSVIETPIQGFVTGEDGKNCFRGNLVSKQGALIARSALAGIFSGIGHAVAQQYQQISTTPFGNVQTLDPKRVGEEGLATGTSNAMEKIAEFYLARASETYPIIEVDANRRGEIVLTNGVDLENEISKFENINNDEKEKVN